MITFQRNPKAILNYLRYRMREGRFRYLPFKKGAHGSCSELEMHCHIVNKPARFAIIDKRYGRYAYVVYEDGHVSDGLFTLYADGNFCLH